MIDNPIVITVLVVLLAGCLGPALDDNHAEWSRSTDLQTAINTAIAQERFAQAAQELCGPQATWQQDENGSVICRTRYGKPTITVRVAP